MYDTDVERANMRLASGTGLFAHKAQSSLSASDIHAATREENKLQSGILCNSPQEVGQSL